MPGFTGSSWRNRLIAMRCKIEKFSAELPLAHPRLVSAEDHVERPAREGGQTASMFAHRLNLPGFKTAQVRRIPLTVMLGRIMHPTLNCCKKNLYMVLQDQPSFVLDFDQTALAAFFDSKP
jgi:hypothetical protein